MSYTNDQKRRALDRSGGKCHLCGTQLHLGAYGKRDSPFGWHMDHSVAKARGGHPTNENNLRAACIPCNVSKGAGTNGRVRAQAGRTRSPLTERERTAARTTQGVAGLTAGAAVGAFIGGPIGAVIGGALGAAGGASIEPPDPGLAEPRRCKAMTAAGKPCGNWAIPTNYGFCGVHR